MIDGLVFRKILSCRIMEADREVSIFFRKRMTFPIITDIGIFVYAILIQVFAGVPEEAAYNIVGDMIFS